MGCRDVDGREKEASRTTEHQPCGDRQGLLVLLRPDQLDWLTETAASQVPPLSLEALIERLVDDAALRARTAATLRAERLEVYAASGYREHHPDYPDIPSELTDV